MSANIFQSGFQNIGARALAQATDEANKYNQELTKKEMISQTEESLGGVKLFTSGRELGSQILKNSKLKPYLKQQAKKLFKKAKPDEPDEPPTDAPPTDAPPTDAPPAEPELPETTTQDLQSQWDAPDEPEVGDGVEEAAANEEPEIVSKTISNVVGKGTRRLLTNDEMDLIREERLDII